MRALGVVLASAPQTQPMDSREDWSRRHRAIELTASTPIELAILAGFEADRVAYAFASAYQAALRALVPGRPVGQLASLSVTERGGGHPRAIEARLDLQTDGSYLLYGRKRWATLGGQAGLLLVAASTGLGADGHKQIRLARVDGSAEGVTRTPMPDPPFTPEIAHDAIELTAVRVRADELCPGDGYELYVKPFRTVEDIYVHAAISAYLLREARLHELPRALVDQLAALIAMLGALAQEDPKASVTHVALAGALGLAHPVLEELSRVWAETESPAHARWERDRVLLSVASDARQKRSERAWETISKNRP